MPNEVEKAAALFGLQSIDVLQDWEDYNTYCEQWRIFPSYDGFVGFMLCIMRHEFER